MAAEGPSPVKQKSSVLHLLAQEAANRGLRLTYVVVNGRNIGAPVGYQRGASVCAGVFYFFCF